MLKTSLYMPISYVIFWACSCFICFVLHVVKSCLDVVFVKTCIYTCTNSEQHLIHIYLHFMLICTHYLHMYRLVLMILIYTCFAKFSCFTSCICIFNSNLINIHVYPWVSCLHANTIDRLFYVWDMYVYC